MTTRTCDKKGKMRDLFYLNFSLAPASLFFLFYPMLVVDSLSFSFPSHLPLISVKLQLRGLIFSNRSFLFCYPHQPPPTHFLSVAQKVFFTTRRRFNFTSPGGGLRKHIFKKKSESPLRLKYS